MAAGNQRFLVGQQHPLVMSERRQHAGKAHHAHYAHQHVVAGARRCLRERLRPEHPLTEAKILRNFIHGDRLHQSGQFGAEQAHLFKELFLAGIGSQSDHLKTVCMQLRHLAGLRADTAGRTKDGQTSLCHTHFLLCFRSKIK